LTDVYTFEIVRRYYAVKVFIPLYFYSTLALILRNQTIRFTSLKDVDDLQEVMSAEGKAYGKYCFVSCWTYEAKESIPMWKMYSDSMKGIRIGLPKFPFREFDDGHGAKTYVSPPYDRDDYFIYPIDSDMFLTPVKYSDKPCDLLTEVEHSDGSISFNPHSFSCKSEYWGFQKECRYKLYIIPPAPDKKNGVRSDMTNYLKNLRMCPDLSINYFDLEIKPDLLKHIELTTGPAIKPGSGEDILVAALTKEFGLPSHKYSCLLDKIRMM
jgi:hypothetical protein